jgi:DNA repair exonuclease SbcCD nuclease subunit
MVTIRTANKYAHPGLVDVDTQNSQQRASKLEGRSQLQTKTAVSKIDALKKTLLTEQRERSVNAQNPPGPSVAKQLHTRPLSADEQVSPALKGGSVWTDGTYLL